jgi:hypothetical protein
MSSNSSDFDTHSSCNPSFLGNDTNPKKKYTKEQREEARTRMRRRYFRFYKPASYYCQWCKKKCKWYHILEREVKALKEKEVQIKLAERTQYYDSIRWQRNKRQIENEGIESLTEKCSICARKRLFIYELDRERFALFEFPWDNEIPHKPKASKQIDHFKDCQQRIETTCTKIREPVAFCTYKMPLEDRKKLTAFLKENKNKCNCNEVPQKQCPNTNSCDEIIESNKCPKTIPSFIHIPPDEVEQKLHD